MRSKYCAAKGVRMVFRLSRSGMSFPMKHLRFHSQDWSPGVGMFDGTSEKRLEGYTDEIQ